MEDRVERDQKLIDQIGKLLAVAAKTKNEHERDTFTKKAMDLIAANNLDMAAIEMGSSGAKAAKRSDEKRAGGLYQWQRDLWRAVSDLNFCMYWTLYTYDKGKVSKYHARKYGGVKNVPDYMKGGYRFEHRLVGRVVNIAASRAMCEYLEQTIERLVKERWPDQPTLWFCSEATAYREGIADEIENKIYDRRREQLAEEQRKEQEAKQAEAEKYKGDYSTSTGVTLQSVKKNEEAANYDYLHGEGSFAKLEARRAKYDAEYKASQEAYTKWAEENPEEAAKEEAKRRKTARRSSWNAGTGKGNAREQRRYSSDYYRGRDDGKKVSIDQQVGGGVKGLLK